MRSKSQTAWEMAARCATLAQEADDPQEREHYARLRDAWITLAKRCEPFNIPDVTDSEIDGPIPASFAQTRTPPDGEKGRGPHRTAGWMMRANIVAKYPFEMSRRFSAIQPILRTGDYSRTRCGNRKTPLDARLERDCIVEGQELGSNILRDVSGACGIIRAVKAYHLHRRARAQETDGR
jgi:hypothetical protein